MTEYEILVDSNISYLDDILRLINSIRNWNCTSMREIAEKVTYHYGDGTRGLLNALYNATLSIID